MTRVILLNVWHDDNAGDSAIAQTCIEIAMKRWPGAEIEVRTMLSAKDPSFGTWNRHLRRRFPQISFLPAFYPEPLSGGRMKKMSVGIESLRAIFLGLKVTMSRQRAVRSYMAGAAAVVVVGGSDLFEIRRPFTSRWRLRRITEAAVDASRVGVPVYLWGHTLGPFETNSGKRTASRLLKSAAQVLVRDEGSLKVALDLAPSADPQLVPDLGFAIRPGELPESMSVKEWGRYVAIVPRMHFFDGDGGRTDRLLDQFADFARGLLERGEVDSVVLVPQVTGPSEVEDDRIVVNRLASKIGDTRVKVVDGEFLGPSEFCQLYSQALGVIAVRLHGAIFSMAGGTPALAVSYWTGKTSGVMGGLGLNDSWTDFDDCTVDYLMNWWDLISADGRVGVIETVVAKARRDLSLILSASA
jgi:colanic acid/amylovoran biosynthesis protein